MNVYQYWLAGKGLDEKGYDTRTGECIISIDPRYFRPTEVQTLLGDPSKAMIELGWIPAISFDQMVKEMVKADHEAAKKDALIKEKGFKVYDYHE